MATTFTNNWKNIINKLESVLRSEFKGALPVYRGHTDAKAGNQYLQLNPASSDLVEYTIKQEIREFSIEIMYHLLESSIKEPTLDHIMRTVSRVESLIHDNTSMTYTNENSVTEQVYNCRAESTELNSGDDEDVYIVVWDWKCLHRTNLV
ncbi:hypothetical protein CMI37_05320 [Candidatus Pacearchaeota archaeon]|nr:hypothetical protein [Candidatus Pacearchaeota archaeon]